MLRKTGAGNRVELTLKAMEELAAMPDGTSKQAPKSAKTRR